MGLKKQKLYGGRLIRHIFIFKVFPSTICPYHGVKVHVTCFRISVKVPTGEFPTFTIESLQNNTSNAISKLNLMKI